MSRATTPLHAHSGRSIGRRPTVQRSVWSKAGMSDFIAPLDRTGSTVHANVGLQRPGGMSETNQLRDIQAGAGAPGRGKPDGRSAPPTKTVVHLSRGTREGCGCASGMSRRRPAPVRAAHPSEFLPPARRLPFLSGQSQWRDQAGTPVPASNSPAA
jgi:hypothetical protein